MGDGKDRENQGGQSYDPAQDRDPEDADDTLGKGTRNDGCLLDVAFKIADVNCLASYERFQIACSLIERFDWVLRGRDGSQITDMFLKRNDSPG